MTPASMVKASHIFMLKHSDGEVSPSLYRPTNEPSNQLELHSQMKQLIKDLEKLREGTDVNAERSTKESGY